MRVTEALSAYRADRAPVVVMIDRIDTTIAHLARSHLASLELADLRRSDIDAYRHARLAAGVVPATVRRELVTLRAAARLAWREGLISRVPPIPVPPRSRPRDRVLDNDEIRALLSAAPTVGPRCEAFVRLLLATGARVSAIVELPWSRVDLDRRIIDLRSDHPLAARMKHRAVVPITASTARWLLQYRRRSIPTGGRGSPPKQPPGRVVGLGVSSARAQLHRAADLAGVHGVTPHVMRHTVATRLLRKVPLVIASRMLGHKSVSITADEYGHLLTADLVPAAAALDPWFRAPRKRRQR